MAQRPRANVSACSRYEASSCMTETWLSDPQTYQITSIVASATKTGVIRESGMARSTVKRPAGARIPTQPANSTIRSDDSTTAMRKSTWSLLVRLAAQHQVLSTERKSGRHRLDPAQEAQNGREDE